MKAKLIVVLIVAVLGVWADLWTKAWSVEQFAGSDGPLGPERTEMEIVPDYFHLTFVPNPHGAFSIFKNVPESIRRIGLIVASVLAIVVIGFFILRPGTGWWMTSAFALVLAGAIGNLYDRLALGYVRDFIDWHYRREFTWPTFNLADSYISVGVTILIVITLFSRAPRTSTAEMPANS